MNFRQASEPALDHVSCNTPRVTLSSAQATPEVKAGLGEVDRGACDFIPLSHIRAFHVHFVPQLSTKDYGLYPSLGELGTEVTCVQVLCDCHHFFRLFPKK